MASKCHSVSFVMYIAGAKFEEQCLKCAVLVVPPMTSSLSSIGIKRKQRLQTFA